MAKSKKSKVRSDVSLYSLKKCPFCFEMLNLKADRCDKCKNKVGSINKTGFADKPTNWKAYSVAFLAWVAFAFYVWWAFLDRQ